MKIEWEQTIIRHIIQKTGEQTKYLVNKWVGRAENSKIYIEIIERDHLRKAPRFGAFVGVGEEFYKIFYGTDYGFSVLEGMEYPYVFEDFETLAKTHTALSNMVYECVNKINSNFKVLEKEIKRLKDNLRKDGF